MPQEQSEFVGQVGSVIQRDGEEWRVTRFCESVTLFHDKNMARPFIVREKYLQLRSQSGAIGFQLLTGTLEDYTGPESKIEGQPQQFAFEGYYDTRGKAGRKRFEATEAVGGPAFGETDSPQSGSTGTSEGSGPDAGSGGGE